MTISRIFCLKTLSNDSDEHNKQNSVIMQIETDTEIPLMSKCQQPSWLANQKFEIS